MQDSGLSKYTVSTQDHYICNWSLIKVFFFSLCMLFVCACTRMTNCILHLHNGTPIHFVFMFIWINDLTYCLSFSYKICNWLGQVTKCDPFSMSNNKLISMCMVYRKETSLYYFLSVYYFKKFHQKLFFLVCNL